MAKILVIHGPNLSLLGKRNPEVYGKFSLDEINHELRELAKEKDIELDIIQSDHEGEIVEIIGKADDNYQAIIINPAAYTHTSVAIRDAIESVSVPTIEVHLSNIYAREDFRKKSLIAPVSIGQISGFGKNSYKLALLAVIELISKEK
jgi:3-dehydroquinate dehydratase-2